MSHFIIYDVKKHHLPLIRSSISEAKQWLQETTTVKLKAIDDQGTLKVSCASTTLLKRIHTDVELYMLKTQPIQRTP